jgi:uncharacterized cofD-like protein
MTGKRGTRPVASGSRTRTGTPWREKIEQIIKLALTGAGSAENSQSPHNIRGADSSQYKTVILGGGTGLSTVVGGNSQLRSWPENPFAGLKQEFPQLTVIVCSTDDGGSTGRILQRLPMIGIGDLRKSFVSMIRMAELARTYRFSYREALTFARVMQQIFHYRFPSGEADPRILRNPVLAADAGLRERLPQPLAAELKSLGTFLEILCSKAGLGPAGQCLGNLILTAAIFRESGRFDRPPSMRDIHAGLNRLARLSGVAPGCLHPATSIPGQLKFRYANGVEVYGQSKSSRSKRGFPVERISAEYLRPPTVERSVLRSLQEADLIIYAPGSLYTSIIPILQLQPVAEAIRANKKALKILGSNFWIQAGETDISLRQSERGFLVSDLIEAYHRNIGGGATELFQVVLSANLEHIPGNILRSYELEGKIPIHLDRGRVEQMGFLPIEATLFMPDYYKPATVIHHDPARFSVAVRSLLYAWECLPGAKQHIRSHGRKKTSGNPGGPKAAVWQHAGSGQRPPLCEYMASIRAALDAKNFGLPLIKETLANLAWQNRDIHPDHLSYFDGASVVPNREWNRSTLWDNVLGYFDPENRMLKIHEEVLGKPSRLREELLISLGESLLGKYILSRNWSDIPKSGSWGSRCYAIQLRPERERACLLSPAQLDTYLKLARMSPDHRDPREYRIVINPGEGFLPPGLLFGLVYAWYLDNSYASTMEYEMSLLHWPPRLLMPHQAKERARKQALVSFFRTEVFGHRDE